MRIDNSGDAGITISTPTANAVNIYHNTPLDGASAGIKFDGPGRYMTFYTVNGTERMRINNQGYVGIGTVPGWLFHVSGSTANDYIARMYNTNGTGYGLYVNTAQNYAVQGAAGVYYGVHGSAPEYAIGAFASGQIGLYTSAGTNYGVYAIATSQYGVHGRAVNYGVWGYTTGSLGVYGQADGIQGVYGYATGNYAIYGISASPYGGYIQGGGYYSYIGDAASGRKITGNGSVSEIIPTEKHGRITLTAPESPEYWYQDFGTVQMVNGKARVELDPILADIIIVDMHNPLNVFCQDNMINSNGVAVINKTAQGFDLVEKNGGTHSGEISYQIVAKPKTNYGEGRFQQAPGPALLDGFEPAAAKAANRPMDREKPFKWPADWEVYKYNPADFTKPGRIVEAGPQAGLYKNEDGSFSKTPAVSPPSTQTTVPGKRKDK